MRQLHPIAVSVCYESKATDIDCMDDFDYTADPTHAPQMAFLPKTCKERIYRGARSW